MCPWPPQLGNSWVLPNPWLWSAELCKTPRFPEATGPDNSCTGKPNGPWLYFLLGIAFPWASKFLLSAFFTRRWLASSLPIFISISFSPKRSLRSNYKCNGDWPIYRGWEVKCLVKSPEYLPNRLWCHTKGLGFGIKQEFKFQVSSWSMLWYWTSHITLF